VSWANTTRQKRKAKRRADWHQVRIDTSPTEKQRLYAACAWLVSEAWRAGLLDEAFEHVMTKVHDIREKEANDDSHDYAA
jgi:hypothetical protein